MESWQEPLLAAACKSFAATAAAAATAAFLLAQIALASKLLTFVFAPLVVLPARCFQQQHSTPQQTLASKNTSEISLSPLKENIQIEFNFILPYITKGKLCTV